jgi:hypothetical protein
MKKEYSFKCLNDFHPHSYPIKIFTLYFIIAQHSDWSQKCFVFGTDDFHSVP